MPNYLPVLSLKLRCLGIIWLTGVKTLEFRSELGRFVDVTDPSGVTVCDTEMLDGVLNFAKHDRFDMLCTATGGVARLFDI